MTVPGNGPRFESIDEVQQWAFRELLERGEHAAPRGMPTRELLAHSFVLARPRARIVTSPARRWSLPLAIGEFCWHASGSRDVDALAYYAPRWRAFADERGMVTGSCYGHRIFSPARSGPSRWESLVALLRADPATRRAVLDLSTPSAPDATTLDVSCTSTLQILVRGGRLHAVVQMRSNDAVWGLPYDVFLFTMLQELLAGTLGLELGSYVHGVGSLHLYEKHVGLACRVLAEPKRATTVMPGMEPIGELDLFLAVERAIRHRQAHPALSAYWSRLAEVLEKYARSQSPFGIAGSTSQPTQHDHA